MVNGWFPRIGASGRIASGNTSVWVDGVLVASEGGSPIWAGDTLVYNNRQGATVVGTSSVPMAYNEYRGSDDGRWAGFVGNNGRVDVYSGVTMIRSIDGACAPRFAAGQFAYLRPYQSSNRELVFNDAVIASGPIMDVVLGDGIAVWQIATSAYARALMTLNGAVHVRTDETPIAVFVAPDGKPWIVSGTNNVGTLVRPLDSAFGYLVAGDFYYPDARMVGSRLRLVGSYSNGAPRFDEWIDFTATRTNLLTLPPPPWESPAIDVPAIGRPMWVGSFVMWTSSSSFPGNCGIYISKTATTALLSCARGTIAAYVAATPDEGDVDVLEDRLAAAKKLMPAIRTLAYWTRGAQNGRIPNGADYIGVEAYRMRGEPLGDFADRVRNAIVRCGSLPVVIIAQLYTSNLDHDTDLNALVPVYAKLARANQNVVGIVAFHSGARATGWEDHPEVHDVWNALIRSVPRAPDMLPPLVAPPPPAPVTKFPAARRWVGADMNVYLKLNGKYVGVEPGTDRVYADRLSGGAWEEIELKSRGDGSFTARFVAADKQLSIQPNGSLETRPSGTDGAYEIVRATTQPEGLNLLYRSSDDHVLGTPLTIVEA